VFGRDKNSSGRRTVEPQPFRRGSVTDTESRGHRSVLETLYLEPGKRRKSSQRVRLVDLCAPWLTLIAVLQRATSLPDAAGLRARALEFRSNLDRDARAGGLSARDVEDAVFALVAFLDESVLHTTGAAREAWIARPLQLELFGQNIAGEEFFTRLELLRKQREERIEALEVYYCCLAFGFAGKMRLAGVDQLRGLVAEVERDVAAVRGLSRKTIAPHAGRHDEIADVVAEGLPVWLSVAIFVPAMLLVFLVIKGLASHHANQAADAISGLLMR
jgi:type VI secretion system protein ImpK